MPINNNNYLIHLIAVLLMLTSSISSFANMPDYYNEPGENPFREQNDFLGYDRVDPFTGKLQLHHIDLFIPGNGGLDIKVQRTYSAENNKSGLNWKDPWSIHFGYIEFNPYPINPADPPLNLCYTGEPSNKYNPVLVLPDGSKSVMSAGGNYGATFITKTMWRANCSPSGMTVTSPTGLVYQMNLKNNYKGINRYYVTSITNAEGKSLQISYYTTADRGAYVKSVSRDVGVLGSSDYANVNFNYSTRTLSDATIVMLLTSVSHKSQTWNYSYTGFTAGDTRVTGSSVVTTNLTGHMG